MRDAARCPQHAARTEQLARESQAARDAVRGPSQDRGYDRSWKQVRDAYLASHPTCEQCQQHHAVLVHHVKPLADGGSRLGQGNLQAICGKCHQQTHAAMKRTHP